MASVSMSILRTDFSEIVLGEALGYADGELDKIAVAHPAGDDEQFQVESETLSTIFGRTAASVWRRDQLDVSLGVPVGG